MSSKNVKNLEKEETKDALTKLEIKSVSIKEAKLVQGSSQSFSIVIQYQTEQDITVRLSTKSELFTIELPDELYLTAAKTRKKITAKLQAVEVGSETITLSVRSTSQKATETIEALSVPSSLAVAFTKYPTRLVKTKESFVLTVRCSIKDASIVRDLPILISIKDGRKIAKKEEHILNKHLKTFSFEFSKSRSSLKSYSVNIKIDNKIVAKAKAPELVLISSPRNIPKGLGEAEVYRGRKPSMNLVVPLITDSAEDFQLAFRRVVSKLSKVVYLSFDFTDSKENKEWAIVEKFINKKGKKAPLLLVGILPNEQPLIILTAKNDKEEFEYQQLSIKINELLRKKRKGKCLVQQGFIAHGPIIDYFEKTKTKASKVIPLVVTSAFLDYPKKLADALLEIVTLLDK